MNELSVRAAAREHPRRQALVVDGEPWSFRRLAARVEEAAARMDRRLHERSEAFVLVGRSDLDTLLLLYAALEVGRTVVLLHPRSPETERRRLVRDLGIERWSDPREVDAESILAVVATSGTSGRPKAVALSRRAFLASAAGSARHLGWRAGDRWLLSLPLAHIGGLSIVTRCLIARRAVVLPPAVDGFDATAIGRWIERQRITLLSLVPTMLRRLLDLGDWSPPAHLRALLLGGAAASPGLLAEAADRGWPVLTTYGLTEACSQVATQRYGTVQRGELGCGELLPGVEARIRDGVLELRGPTVMSGYLPAAGAGVGLDPEGWLRTGDRARFDEDGRLFILGRCDELIVTGGENVDPRELEQVLEEHPRVAAACVVGVADREWGEAVAAVVVAGPGGEPPTPEELRRAVRARLAVYKCPRRWCFLDALPTTATGKVDRRAVAELAAGTLGGRPQDPRSP
ncbi:MAG: AMP-binding protein [bacterium]|nr:AMP-binding protein [bacterium]